MYELKVNGVTRDNDTFSLHTEEFGASCPTCGQSTEERKFVIKMRIGARSMPDLYAKNFAEALATAEAQVKAHGVKDPARPPLSAIK